MSIFNDLKVLIYTLKLSFKDEENKYYEKNCSYWSRNHGEWYCSHFAQSGYEVSLIDVSADSLQEE